MKITLWKTRLRDLNIAGRLLWAILFPIIGIFIALFIIVLVIPIIFIMWIALLIGIFFPKVVDNG